MYTHKLWCTVTWHGSHYLPVEHEPLRKGGWRPVSSTPRSRWNTTWHECIVPWTRCWRLTTDPVTRLALYPLLPTLLPGFLSSYLVFLARPGSGLCWSVFCAYHIETQTDYFNTLGFTGKLFLSDSHRSQSNVKTKVKLHNLMFSQRWLWRVISFGI
jgi:hypothetical protein